MSNQRTSPEKSLQIAAWTMMPVSPSCTTVAPRAVEQEKVYIMHLLSKVPGLAPGI